MPEIASGIFYCYINIVMKFLKGKIMTIIVCKVEKDKIVLGADSCITYGMTSQSQTNPTKNKIWKFSDDFAAAACGSLAEAELFNTYCKRHRPISADTENIQRFMVEFMHWAKHNMTEATAPGGNISLENDYLIVFDKKAYKSAHGSVWEISNYECSGSGYWFAQTMLHIGKSVKKALNVACQLNPFCQAPLTIYEFTK